MITGDVCRKLIRERKLTARSWHDTAGAARHVAELGDPSVAAIASSLAAELYGLAILAGDIEDDLRKSLAFFREQKIAVTPALAYPYGSRPEHGMGLLAERLERLAETVEVIKGVMAGGPFRFQGRHVRVDGARARPRARQRPRPPVWVGGRGDRLLDVVAAHADGWNTVWTLSPESYRPRLEVLERACEKRGRDPGTVTRSVGLYALVGESPADLARRFERYVFDPVGTMLIDPSVSSTASSTPSIPSMPCSRMAIRRSSSSSP